jgi:hypothetical protein
MGMPSGRGRNDVVPRGFDADQGNAVWAGAKHYLKALHNSTFRLVLAGRWPTAGRTPGWNFADISKNKSGSSLVSSENIHRSSEVKRYRNRLYQSLGNLQEWIAYRSEEQAITGYAVDFGGTVVSFRKGKRKGVDGRWHPAAGGKNEE